MMTTTLQLTDISLARMPLGIRADVLEEAGCDALAAAVRSGDQDALWSRIVLHGDADLPHPGWLRFGVGCDTPHPCWVVSCRLPLWAAHMLCTLAPDYYYVAVRDDRSGDPCPITALDPDTLGALLVADALERRIDCLTSWDCGQIRNLPCELTSLRVWRRFRSIGIAIMALTAPTEESVHAP